MPKILIYTTQVCPYCHAAKDFFRSKGLEFEEIDVTGDDEARRKLVEKSDGRKTVPQIFIDGTGIGGYSDLIALDQGGKLGPLLQKA